MDKLSDFLNSIKERVVNPFFISFIIAWVCWNPKITVALLWYDASQIQAAGYSSIYVFLTKKSGLWVSLLLPLISALLYTAVIGNLISALNAFTQKWGEKWNLNISKKGSIPTEKYLSLKENFEKGMTTLESIIKDESKSIEQFNNEKTARLTAEAEANNLKSRINLIERNQSEIFDNSFMKGTWKCTYDKGEFVIDIQENNLAIIDGKNYLRVYTIHDFVYNKSSKYLFFTKHTVPDHKGTLTPNAHKVLLESGLLDVSYMVVNLKVIDENNLHGTENINVSVTYVRTDKRTLPITIEPASAVARAAEINISPSEKQD